MPRCKECAHETHPERAFFEGEYIDSQTPCRPILKEHRKIVKPAPDMECLNPECFTRKTNL